MPNKLSKFWQELKRRNVVRVTTVYAGAAFVIIELINNITEPLKLPEWTPTLVIVLLAIGFPVVIIFSWIYDIHPEEGIVKTETAHKEKHDDIVKSTNGWKIASYISFVVIVGLIVLNVFPGKGKKEILDKSIAVLPFINDSQDQENEHFINGIMEELLINLQTIKELRVPGRTSTEQYRSNPKPIPEIASEMNVAYIVEGSGQRYGDHIRLRVQLVEGATDRHIWAKSYEEVIHGPEDIFSIQSDIAQAIAEELHALITPEEKQIIQKTPTSSLTAYDFFRQGKEEFWNYLLHHDQEALDRAELLYKKALANDTSYALAYIGLAETYWKKHYMENYLAGDFLDSVPVLIDIALSYDDQLADAYLLRGDYYAEMGKSELALNEIYKSLELNPNNWIGYNRLVSYYFDVDLVKTLENKQKAIALNRGPQLPYLLSTLGSIYETVGIAEKSEAAYQQAFDLSGDSTYY